MTREGRKARIRLGLQRQAGLGQAERYGKVHVSKGTQKRNTEAESWTATQTVLIITPSRPSGKMVLQKLEDEIRERQR